MYTSCCQATVVGSNKMPMRMLRRTRRTPTCTLRAKKGRADGNISSMDEVRPANDRPSVRGAVIAMDTDDGSIQDNEELTRLCEADYGTPSSWMNSSWIDLDIRSHGLIEDEAQRALWKHFAKNEALPRRIKKQQNYVEATAAYKAHVDGLQKNKARTPKPSPRRNNIVQVASFREHP